MRESWRTLATASAFAAAVLAATALHADSTHDRNRSKQMMVHGGVGMMGKMNAMMEGCGRMMGGGSDRPNEQWQKKVPKAPEKKG